MRHGRWIPLLTVAGFAAMLSTQPPALEADEPYYARFDESTRTWTIGNPQIEAQLRLDSEGLFRCLALLHKASGKSWKPPETEAAGPVSLTVDNVAAGARSPWDLKSHAAARIEPEGIRQTIVLGSRVLPGEVRFEADVHAGQPFLRYRSFYRNTGGGVSRVTEADMLPWKFEGRGQQFRALFIGQWAWSGERGNFEPHEVDLNGLEGPFEAFTGAYGNHSTWAAIHDAGNNGLVFGWEFDGRARAHAEYVRASGVLRTDSQIQRLAHPVAPGEEFEIPAAFVGLFHGDWDEAGYRTQRFAEAVVAARLPASEAGRFPYVAFDSWGFQWDINEAVLREGARRAAELGVELYTIDLGWAKVTGDWYSDPEKFPNGLKPISDYVHSLGMKFGLHLPFGEAMADSQVLRQHPDWAVVASPNKQRGYFGAVGICLSHKPAQEWVIAEILRVVRENGVDWLLQDGENMVKGCFAANHSHHPDDSNYSNSVEGLNVVQAAVRKAEPNLMWENCEDGGNMQTFRMLGHYVTSIVNDNAGFLTTRQSVYGATYPFPPRYTDRYMEVTPWGNYQTRSHFFGGPLILMDRITDWPDWMVDFAKKEIALYKSLRGHISQGKVYHISPRPDGTFNDSIQSHLEAAGRSVIMVYREETASDRETVRPRGLAPEKNYRVRFQDNDRTYIASGKTLMEDGIIVELPVQYFAEIVYIEPVN